MVNATSPSPGKGEGQVVEKEVIKLINPNDVSIPTIRNLFFQQIKNLTIPRHREDDLDLFDYQFSDKWLGGV